MRVKDWFDCGATCSGKHFMPGCHVRHIASLVPAATMWMLVAAIGCHGAASSYTAANVPTNVVAMSSTKICSHAARFQPLAWERRQLRSCRARKKVRRAREDIRREQQALLEKARREIDAIAAEYHRKLPREEASAIGAIYARYSSRFQDSIADQVRTLFEEAHRQGIFIPRDHVFFDLAVRGWKDRRPGLTELRKAIRQKSFDVFLVFTTSRLFRRTYKAMQFVEEELVDRGLRAIFVKSQLDTVDGDNWRSMFQLFALMDEAMVRMYGSHVQAAHEGLFARGMVCMSLSVGYTGEEVAGELTKRKLPRRRIVIAEDAAKWVRQMFHWYVEEGVGLSEIARRLNEAEKAPPPSKSLTGQWTHALVRSHLMREVYRGYWVYGDKKTVWSSEKDYAKQVARDTPLASGHFEDLRIVSDKIWRRAQELLQEENANSGRKSKDGDRESRPRLLRGLFVCPEHERQLVVGGPQGRVLFCPLCRAVKAEKRPIFTHLNRALALELTSKKLKELIQANDSLVNDVIVACQQAAETAQKPNPEVLTSLRAKLRKLEGTIDFNRRHPGDSEDEQLVTGQLLKELNREKNTLLADIATQEEAAKGVIVVPSPEEVKALLADLDRLMTDASTLEDEEQMRPARRIIDELTGGRIELTQMGERKAKRGWLQGRFYVDLNRLILAKVGGVSVSSSSDNRLEVTVDYRQPKLIDAQADQAKRLWDQGMLNKQIAKEMQLLPSYVTKLLKHWHDSRGQSRPDGRKRRAHVTDKQTTSPLYKRIADGVMHRVNEGFSNLAIAKQFDTSDATVAKAIVWWFESRGLPVLSAADRRRKMLQRAKASFECGTSIKDLAGELGYSPRGLKLALASYYKELGETMPDGRSRRSELTSDGNPTES